MRGAASLRLLYLASRTRPTTVSGCWERAVLQAKRASQGFRSGKIVAGRRLVHDRDFGCALVVARVKVAGRATSMCPLSERTPEI